MREVEGAMSKQKGVMAKGSRSIHQPFRRRSTKIIKLRKTLSQSPRFLGHGRQRGARRVVRSMVTLGREAVAQRDQQRGTARPGRRGASALKPAAHVVQDARGGGGAGWLGTEGTQISRRDGMAQQQGGQRQRARL